MLGLGLQIYKHRNAGGSSGPAGILDAYPGAAFAAAVDVLLYASHSVTDDAVGSQTQGQTGAYTVRVRRSSDNAVRSFTATEVSDGTLVTWTGAGNDAFVVCLYDQSGNGNHILSDTATRQPRIVENGILETENDKAQLAYVNNSTGMLSSYSPNSGNVQKTLFFIVNHNDDISLLNVFGSSTNGADYGYYQQDGGNSTTVNNRPTVSAEIKNGADWSYSNRGDVYTDLIEQSLVSTNIEFNFNDSILALGYRYNNNSNTTMLNTQLFAVFDPQLSSTDRLGVETALNNTYRIYPVAGSFLAKYPGASVALALKNLNGLNMPVVLVRRSSDDAERAFTAVEVSDGTLVNWVNESGLSSGYVRTLYDQSLNGNHAEQATPVQQPAIVQNGVLVQENGEAALSFDEVLHTKLVFTPNLDFSSGMFLLGVYANRSSGAGYLFFESIELGRRSNGNYRFHSADFSANGGTHSTDQVLLIGQEDGATAKIFANGVEYGQGASSLVSQTIERIGQKTLQANVNLAIAYNSDQSANRPNMEIDLNDLYGVSVDIPRPGSFLANHAGAAAAFSLEDLTGNDPVVVNVRRSSDNATMDFRVSEITDGTLVTWVGPGNDGHVVTWYDQGLQGNDATQATASAQPKIVDGGSLIVENGRAALDMLGTTSAYLDTGIFTLISQPVTYFIIAKRTSAPAFQVVIAGKTANKIDIGTNNLGELYAFGDSIGVFPGGAIPSSQNNLIYVKANGNNTEIAVNNSAVATGINIGSAAIQVDSIRLGTAQDINFELQGYISTAIIYPSDQSTNRESLESDLNDIYATFPSETNSFRILVDTTNTGVSNNDQFQFTGAQGNYMVDVYDATGTTFIERHTGLTDEQTITIGAGAGQYELWVLPIGANGFNRIYFNNTGDKDKLLQIRNWGNVAWSTMQNAFYGCSNATSISSFVSPNLSSVTNMSRMFRNCSSVTTLDVSGFNTANVTNMVQMFFRCTDLVDAIGIENFNISSTTDLSSFLEDTTLPAARYDTLLIGWAAQNVQNNVPFHGGNSQYTPGGAAEAARNTLINTYGWTITDGGPA